MFIEINNEIVKVVKMTKTSIIITKLSQEIENNGI